MSVTLFYLSNWLTNGVRSSIAGKNIANPVAMILSVAMMFRYSFGMENEAKSIENAVSAVLDAGVRTPDLGGKTGTTDFGDAVVSHIRESS